MPGGCGVKHIAHRAIGSEGWAELTAWRVLCKAHCSTCPLGLKASWWSSPLGGDFLLHFTVWPHRKCAEPNAFTFAWNPPNCCGVILTFCNNVKAYQFRHFTWHKTEIKTSCFLMSNIMKHSLRVIQFANVGADSGFWSGGTIGVLTPRGALSPKFAQNGGFSLKIAWKLHDLKKILGARGPPGSATGMNSLREWTKAGHGSRILVEGPKTSNSGQF